MDLQTERISGFSFALRVNCFLETPSIWLVIFMMSTVLKILKRNYPQTLDVMNIVICGAWHMVATLANNLALNKLSFGHPLDFQAVVN